VPTALVTGPTAGIGAEFAEQLAAAGHDLVLVARRADRLAELAERLRTDNGVRAEALVADLADPADLDRVVARLTDTDRPIDLLVNNAGFGLTGSFLDRDVTEDLRMLDVLVRAPLVLTRAAVPPMVARGSGAVLNVSSVAGFLPRGTYGASKAWLTSFTEGLASLLDGTGVKAMALCPGWVRTEFHTRGDIDSSDYPAISWVPVDRLVRDALADLAAGKVVSIPTPLWKVVSAGLRVAPRALIRRFAQQKR